MTTIYKFTNPVISPGVYEFTNPVFSGILAENIGGIASSEQAGATQFETIVNISGQVLFDEMGEGAQGSSPNVIYGVGGIASSEKVGSPSIGPDVIDIKSINSTENVGAVGFFNQLIIENIGGISQTANELPAVMFINNPASISAQLLNVGGIKSSEKIGSPSFQTISGTATLIVPPTRLIVVRQL